MAEVLKTLGLMWGANPILPISGGNDREIGGEAGSRTMLLFAVESTVPREYVIRNYIGGL